MTKKQKAQMKSLIEMIRVVNNGSDESITATFGVNKKTAIENIVAAMDRDIDRM